MKNLINKTKNFATSLQPYCMDLIRIYLGIGLFFRGVLFLSNPDLIFSVLPPNAQFILFGITHYIALAHLGGGILLAFGLLTRLSALIQIPILLGAVFFVHLPMGLFIHGQSLEFSCLVLFLLVIIAIYGPGKWSADAFLEKDKNLL